MSRHFKNVKFLEHLFSIQSLGKGESVVIYDRRIKKIPEVNKWLAGFRLKYPVNAGEELKELKNFPQHFEKLAQLLKGTSRKITVIGVGGGSVTDFAGFFASTFKRGVPLVLIPSTWLAAIDSAHGGKTALNSGDHKNALGTFYFAEKVFVVKSLLLGQPKERAIEAYGELLKMALISGKSWTASFFKSELNGGDMWRFLRSAIEAKYRVLQKDPYETNGIRKILNLGHTLGHVFEKHFGTPHGLAVGKGLVFAAAWSEKRGLMSSLQSRQIEKLVIAATENEKINLKGKNKLLSKKVLLQGLRGDKKITGNELIDFVFPKKLGQVIVQSVSLSEIVAEAQAQGWVR